MSVVDAAGGGTDQAPCPADSAERAAPCRGTRGMPVVRALWPAVHEGQADGVGARPGDEELVACRNCDGRRKHRLVPAHGGTHRHRTRAGGRYSGRGAGPQVQPCLEGHR